MTLPKKIAPQDERRLKRLAQSITRRLFTDTGTKSRVLCDRLALQYKCHDFKWADTGSGWCFSAAVDQVLEVLRRAEARKGRR